jgi:hypothetical protein
MNMYKLRVYGHHQQNVNNPPQNFIIGVSNMKIESKKKAHISKRKPKFNSPKLKVGPFVKLPTEISISPPSPCGKRLLLHPPDAREGKKARRKERLGTGDVALLPSNEESGVCSDGISNILASK